MGSVDSAAHERGGLEARALPVAGDGGRGDGIDGIRIAGRDDAAAEAGSGQARPERSGGDELLDEHVELGSRDAEVVAQARVALAEQPSERVEVAVGERTCGGQHALVLGHHVAAERIVRDELERRVAQSGKPESSGQLSQAWRRPA